MRSGSSPNGRVSFDLLPRIARAYPCLLRHHPYLAPSCNIAPQTFQPIVRLDRDGQRELTVMRLGLVPYLAKDSKIGFSTINAKAENHHSSWIGIGNSAFAVVPARPLPRESDNPFETCSQYALSRFSRAPNLCLDCAAGELGYPRPPSADWPLRRTICNMEA
jgi:hypothetical protein